IFKQYKEMYLFVYSTQTKRKIIQYTLILHFCRSAQTGTQNPIMTDRIIFNHLLDGVKDVDTFNFILNSQKDIKSVIEKEMEQSEQELEKRIQQFETTEINLSSVLQHLLLRRWKLDNPKKNGGSTTSVGQWSSWKWFEVISYIFEQYQGNLPSVINEMLLKDIRSYLNEKLSKWDLFFLTPCLNYLSLFPTNNTSGIKLSNHFEKGECPEWKGDDLDKKLISVLKTDLRIRELNVIAPKYSEEYVIDLLIVQKDRKLSQSILECLFSQDKNCWEVMFIVFQADFEQWRKHLEKLNTLGVFEEGETGSSFLNQFQNNTEFIKLVKSSENFLAFLAFMQQQKMIWKNDYQLLTTVENCYGQVDYCEPVVSRLIDILWNELHLENQSINNKVNKITKNLLKKGIITFKNLVGQNPPFTQVCFILYLYTCWSHSFLDLCLNQTDTTCLFLFAFDILQNNKIQEKYKNWLKWWNQKEQRDKKEIIKKFKTMSNEEFGKWLSNECKWKYHITKDDVDSIRFSIIAYLEFINQDNTEEKVNQLYDLLFLLAHVMVGEIKKEIKMKELTFKELLRQSYCCLEATDFQKINDENLKIHLVDMKDNILESDRDVEKEFESNEPLFKIRWTPIIGKTKKIKNALIVMIAISEYEDNDKWCNLESVKDEDITNFKYIFEQELNYKFVCNEKPKMNKEDVQEFIDKLFIDFKLRRNLNNYDAFIMIISGHGDENDVLVTSEGDTMSINGIRASFDCNEMKSFRDCPKIFIIDVCRGNNTPHATDSTKTRGKKEKKQSNVHNDNGFLMIWSTTKGYKVGDLSLFSKSMKNIIVAKYKTYPLSQMLREIREDIKNKGSGEWYCVESQDTADYEIIFQQKKSV
ncbi:hypothetical protein RFI_25219, partial [Reticulomyxa filosa]